MAWRGGDASMPDEQNEPPNADAGGTDTIAVAIKTIVPQATTDYYVAVFAATAVLHYRLEVKRLNP